MRHYRKCNTSLSQSIAHAVRCHSPSLHCHIGSKVSEIALLQFSALKAIDSSLWFWKLQQQSWKSCKAELPGLLVNQNCRNCGLFSVQCSYLVPISCKFIWIWWHSYRHLSVNLLNLSSWALPVKFVEHVHFSFSIEGTKGFSLETYLCHLSGRLLVDRLSGGLKIDLF